ncbi:MAG: fatty acyl-AMP ligase [Bradymonadia bacterium]
MNAPNIQSPQPLVAPTLTEALDRLPSMRPNGGYTFIDMKGEQRLVTYAEMNTRTRSFAGHLYDQGLQVGDRVGLIVIEPEDFVVAFLGTIRAGMVPVPLYPPMALGELDAYLGRLGRILTKGEVKALVASKALDKIVWGVMGKVPCLKGVLTVEKLVAPREPVADLPVPKADDLCFLQYTSGSTSDPKGVVVQHQHLAANSQAIVDHLEIDRHTDKAFAWLPLYHDMGLIGFVITGTLHGFDIVLMPTLRFLKRPNAWLQGIHDTRSTITFCPPFALSLAARRAKEAQLSKWDLSCLRLVGVGAEPIQPEGARQFTELFNDRCGMPTTVVTPAYGMAEATLAMSMKLPDREFSTRVVDAATFEATGCAVTAEAGAAVLEHVSCGRPLRRHQVRAISAEGKWLPEGVQGELCFRGPSVTAGYLNQPEATSAAFKNGWLHTGDLGYVLDGEIFVTGRLKDLIILNGRNLHPQSLEWTVGTIDGVRKGNVVCFSVPGDGTEALVVALEAQIDAPEDLAETVRDRLRKAEGVPVDHVVILQKGQLPKTSSGKLQRRKARQLFIEGTLEAQGSRAQGQGPSNIAGKATLARHVARSTWARMKHQARGALGRGAFS